MATIADISQTLGDYMLKGWVLTDQPCPTPGCTVPILRSPRGRTPLTTFCVKCNSTENPALNMPETAASSTSAGSIHSPLSTPPTDFSIAPGSPTFIPLEETEQSRHRRAQSDQASSEIGKRLLKGWAMLGDECPNDTCYGVPLVRPPKSGAEKDPRKECVICGHVYVTETDWAGRENLVPFKSQTSELSTSVQSQAGSSHAIFSPAHPFSSPFGRQLAEEKQKLPVETAPQTRIPSYITDTKPKVTFEPPSSSDIGLGEITQILQTSLRVLSGRLSELSSQSILDCISIGTTADSINKVASALGQVRQLQRDQN
ncbi:hypothetical protein HYPSUDRAFT_32023 [Hypholoma sublateritium FD-334 SS-4]|uniref:Uncharacterized protein n=1 Tax=Hypholoma sublateritium (strain FD-334 SS-4) TaxID=945553 RepID=A0A0D2PGK6_HYPSF|nr:hypothetical protein HYPSUDRAFT_32023 [Hypholoma sublateritium FD-334 SS-4]